MRTSSRISLRPLRKTDLVQLEQWFNEPLAFGSYDQPLDLTAADIQVAWEKNQYASLRLVEFEGQTIGWGSCDPDARFTWIASLSLFICLPEFRGRGFGSAAQQLLVNETFQNLPMLQKIEAWTDPRNQAERRSLEKIGFRLEGTLRAKWRLHGVISDLCTYGLLRGEWKSPA